MQNTLILPADPAPAISAGVFSVVPEAAPPARPPVPAIRRILLPFDLSRAGVCALRAVTGFAEKAGAAIHLLHVVRPAETGGVEPKSNRADDHLADASERLLKHWVKRVVQGRVPAFVSIRIGEPVDVIVTRSEAIRADLIVMTSLACGVRNELQRSGAERVSRLARCPVLTIPEKCASDLAYSPAGFPAADWRTILMPVDYSAPAENALRYAAALAAENGATLLLAHGDADGGSDGLGAHQRLRAWAGGILGESLSCETVIWPGGHSLYAILAGALRAEAGLIVLPTRARAWARRFRAGSITDGILRQASCPVLSINETVSAAGT